MIATNFDYYRPESLCELPDAISRAQGRTFLFYGGGSEIISMSRAGSIAPQAVIDVKSIPEVRVIQQKEGLLTLGAAATLAEIAESNRFPLLSATVSRIADHTNQCRITLGGNIAGTIAYREAVLPLLLTDATVTLWQNGNLRQMPIMQGFQKRLQHAPDELVVSFQVHEEYLAMPWVHAKRTRTDKIDYPVVTIAAIKAPDGLRFALSGVLSHPFRDLTLEKVFSDDRKSPRRRAEEILSLLPEPPITDMLARSDWRAFQTRCALEHAINRLEGRIQ